MLQGEINRMYEWADRWQMEFNINKCSRLHVGRHNAESRYTLNDVGISKSNAEKDLGVLVSHDLRPRQQCISARNRANRVLGFIAWSVSNRSPEVILRLYLSLVRPHLDYPIQYWSPYYRKNIDRLESIQRRITKMFQGIRNLTYRED